MYSALARPSSIRAAPAKKRIWSTPGGISSLIVSASGLPVFSDSIRASSSPRSSISSAIRSSARLRSDGVASRHSAKAFVAASTAASTSDSLEMPISAMTSPVAALRTSWEPSPLVATLLPPMKFWRVVVLVDMPLLPSSKGFDGTYQAAPRRTAQRIGAAGAGPTGARRQPDQPSDASEAGAFRQLSLTNPAVRWR